MTDVDEFDDLFAEADLLQKSSQDSLTSAATNLTIYPKRDPDEDIHVFGVSHSSSEGEKDVTLDALHEKEGTETKEGEPLLNHVSIYGNRVEPRSSLRDPRTLRPLERIEAVFETVLDALNDERDELCLTLYKRPAVNTRGTSTELHRDAVLPGVKTRRICFPGKSAEEAWRFAVLTRILELMHEALRSGVVLSKRDMYYRDPALFGRQTVVDRYVDDIAFTFDVPRSMLNVSAVAKGLILGAVSFCRRAGSIVNAAGDRDGMLVPALRDILSVDMKAVTWLLVIEKEASFRSVAASSFWEQAGSEGVIITGKGYPDIATRALLHFMSTPSPQNGFAAPSVFGLADLDPDGLAILSIYKYGSIALSHETQHLGVPQLQWLGLRGEYMCPGHDDVHASQGLLSLTARDRRKAVKILERSCSTDSIDKMYNKQMREALQSMLMLGLKAELQLLDSCPGRMNQLLLSRISCLGRS